LIIRKILVTAHSACLFLGYCFSSSSSTVRRPLEHPWKATHCISLPFLVLIEIVNSTILAFLQHSLILRRFFVLILLSHLLSACSSGGLFLINSAARLGADQIRHEGLAYGEEPWQSLDVYQPKDKCGDRPVMLFFYGGGWNSGAKEDYLFVADSFTSLGYVVVVPDYATYPTGKFPTFIEDGARAFAWTKNNIPAYSGDATRIVLVGHSAGAHLAALLLADDSYLRAEGLSPADASGFAGLAGPYNFTPTEPKYQKIFAPPSNYPKMKVSNYITGKEPPMLLVRGTADKTVAAYNQDRLVASLEQFGVPYRDRRYAGVTHVGLLLDMAPFFKNGAPLINDMHQFFKQHLEQK